MGSIIGLLIEDKYDLLNRLRKKWAIVTNKGANARLIFTFETETDFNIIKNEVHSMFGEGTKKIDNEIKLDFSNSHYSVIVFKVSIKEVYVEIERMESGLRDLSKKISEIIIDFEGLINKKIFRSLLNCKLDLELPFQWKLIRIKKPKGFVIENYIINMEDQESKTKIKIIMENTVSINFKGLSMVQEIVKKLLT